MHESRNKNHDWSDFSPNNKISQSYYCIQEHQEATEDVKQDGCTEESGGQVLSSTTLYTSQVQVRYDGSLRYPVGSAKGDGGGGKGGT